MLDFTKLELEHVQGELAEINQKLKVETNPLIIQELIEFKDSLEKDENKILGILNCNSYLTEKLNRLKAMFEQDNNARHIWWCLNKEPEIYNYDPIFWNKIKSLV